MPLGGQVASCKHYLADLRRAAEPHHPVSGRCLEGEVYPLPVGQGCCLRFSTCLNGKTALCGSEGKHIPLALLPSSVNGLREHTKFGRVAACRVGVGYDFHVGRLPVFEAVGVDGHGIGDGLPLRLDFHTLKVAREAGVLEQVATAGAQVVDVPAILQGAALHHAEHALQAVVAGLQLLHVRGQGKRVDALEQSDEGRRVVRRGSSYEDSRLAACVICAAVAQLHDVVARCRSVRAACRRVL